MSLFRRRRNLGSLIFYSTTYSSLESLVPQLDHRKKLRLEVKKNSSKANEIDFEKFNFVLKSFLN